MQQDQDEEFVEAANHAVDVSVFTLLTAVPRGRYDCYRVDNKGVRPVVKPVLKKIKKLPVGYLWPEEDRALSEVDESLTFPCSPRELVEWVKGTYGNFQLPTAFVNAVEATPAISNQRIKPKGGDNLTPMIWEICYDLMDAGKEIKPRHAMAELKARAEKKIRPLLCVVADGVKYEREDGEEEEICSERLRARIREWKKALTGE